MTSHKWFIFLNRRILTQGTRENYYKRRSPFGPIFPPWHRCLHNGNEASIPSQMSSARLLIINIGFRCTLNGFPLVSIQNPPFHVKFFLISKWGILNVYHTHCVYALWSLFISNFVVMVLTQLMRTHLLQYFHCVIYKSIFHKVIFSKDADHHGKSKKTN